MQGGFVEPGKSCPLLCALSRLSPQPQCGGKEPDHVRTLFLSFCEREVTSPVLTQARLQAHGRSGDMETKYSSVLKSLKHLSVFFFFYIENLGLKNTKCILLTSSHQQCLDSYSCGVPCQCAARSVVKQLPLCRQSRWNSGGAWPQRYTAAEEPRYKTTSFPFGPTDDASLLTELPGQKCLSNLSIAQIFLFFCPFLYRGETPPSPSQPK